jgi:hypothetical protein
MQRVLAALPGKGLQACHTQLAAMQDPNHPQAASGLELEKAHEERSMYSRLCSPLHNSDRLRR